MSKMDEAAASIPPYLFDKLKERAGVVLTPGEVFGAADLWKIILEHNGGEDPLETIFNLTEGDKHE